MPGRSYSAGSGYRYGFNGQEKSDEIAEGLTTAEFWEYDSRIARRRNLDPIYKNSPYETFGSNPIRCTDQNGADSVTFKGSNNSSLTFVNNQLEKKSYSSSIDFRGNKVFNLPNLPDAIGYSIEGSANGSAGPIQGSAKGSISNFVIYTRGSYAWQPFRYAYLGGSVGAGGSAASGVSGGASGNLSLTFSPFVAWFTKKPMGFDYADKSLLTPYSWEAGFLNVNASASITEGIGGNIGGTYFEGVPWSTNTAPNFGWWGVSLDLGVNVGGGLAIGVQNGGAYYKLTELHVSTTKEISSTRLVLKWAECMSAGTIPGTALSDLFYGIDLSGKIKAQVSQGANYIQKVKDVMSQGIKQYSNWTPGFHL